MPDPWENQYNEIVQQAREDALSELSQEAGERLAEEYARQIRRLIARFEAETIDADRARALIGEFEDLMIEYGSRSEAQVKETARRAIGSATDAHRRAIEGAADSAGVDLELPPFDRVNTRAFEASFRRRGLDVIESFKTLSRFSAEASAEVIDEALQDAVAGGLTPEEATERIMRGLVQGDEELRDAIERFGPRGGLRFGESGPIDEATRKLARQIGHNARRIAITETASAYWEGSRVAATESPVVRATRWVLSASHPRADICDMFATQDLYDMGPGVYPAESLPAKPHPFDLCSTEYVFWRPPEWGSQVEFGEPASVTDQTVERVLSGAGSSPTVRQVERIRKNFNGLSRMAYDYYLERAS